ncbi:MAG: hypothetical protein WC510_02080 [Candidatus Omnitrophota bacterium]
MTDKQIKERIKAIVERAKKNGYTIYKNNINKAKPINRICGAIKAKAPYSTEELLCR